MLYNNTVIMIDDKCYIFLDVYRVELKGSLTLGTAVS